MEWKWNESAKMWYGSDGTDNSLDGVTLYYWTNENNTAGWFGDLVVNNVTKHVGHFFGHTILLAKSLAEDIYLNYKNGE
jgi:hypothetical protein